MLTESQKIGLLRSPMVPGTYSVQSCIAYTCVKKIHYKTSTVLTTSCISVWFDDHSQACHESRGSL